MLVLTRNIGQSVYIDGHKIEVMVLGVRGNQVRLGFEAPRDIEIVRDDAIKGKKDGNDR